ncbi:MAG: ATPase [Planctomycetaceae bacterium]|nr:ATPase [Planctomycetaceae bacterium]
MPAPSTSQQNAGTSAPKRKSIGQLLRARDLVTEDQIKQALSSQTTEGHRKLLGEVLIEMGFVTEEQVVEVLAEAYEVPYAKISAKIADPRVAEALPREFLEQQCILPLFLVNGRLTVAVPEPSNVFLIEEIERIAGYSIQIVAATTHDIRQALQSIKPDSDVFVIDDIVDDADSADFSLVEKEVTDLTNLEEVAGHSPVIKLVNYLIYGAVQDAASDIHIEPDDNILRVRYRVDGRLFEKMRPPFQMQAAVVSRIKIMAGLDISERRVPQDGGIHVMLDNRPIDLRVSTMPGNFGEKVVIRIIDNKSTLVSLEKLGFSVETLEQLRTVVHEPNGIVLVTGPTGSGKSTALYAMLNEINSDEVNICTVEDPIEFSLLGVNQFQTNEKANFTFANALRALVRQDPDIIMLGEIRDGETASIATQAALTGHMVLSTLHTNDAASAVTRLINIGVEPYLIAAALRAVLAQRLVRRICNQCKEPTEPSAAIRRTLEAEFGAVDVIYKGVGCSKCRNSGFAGRVGIFELLKPNDQILDVIARDGTLHEIRELAADTGFMPMRADGLQKVKAGLTTVEEVLTATAG